MENLNTYTPFNEVISGFSESLFFLFSPITSIIETRKNKKLANQYVDSLMDRDVLLSIATIINDDILPNMPEGVWDIENLDSLNMKFELPLDNNLILQMKNKFGNFDDPEQQKVVKEIFMQLSGMQIFMMIQLKKELANSAINEIDLRNIRLAREIIQTLDLIINKTKEFIINLDKKVSSEQFKENFKHYASIYLLLLLRIVDIINTYNKGKSIVKKLDYLSMERLKIVEC